MAKEKNEKLRMTKFLNSIPKEMKRESMQNITYEEIENLMLLEEEMNDRNFVINTLSCVNYNLDKLNTIKDEKDLERLNDFLTYYNLGYITYKNNKYVIVWCKNKEEIKNAYYMELQRVLYEDEDVKDIQKEFEEALKKDNDFYSKRIDQNFIQYLKEISGLEELPDFPLKMYYDIYNYTQMYELNIEFKYILNEKQKMALFLLLLNYPAKSIAKLMNLSLDEVYDLKLLNIHICKDSYESKSLVKKRLK